MTLFLTLPLLDTTCLIDSEDLATTRGVGVCLWRFALQHHSGPAASSRRRKTSGHSFAMCAAFAILSRNRHYSGSSIISLKMKHSKRLSATLPYIGVYLAFEGTRRISGRRNGSLITLHSFHLIYRPSERSQATLSGKDARPQEATAFNDENQRCEREYGSIKRSKRSLYDARRKPAIEPSNRSGTHFSCCRASPFNCY
jgi:hypothetical protein